MLRFVLALLAIALPLNLVQAASPLDELRPFLAKHCYECHGAKEQENDLRIDTLGTELSEKRTLEAWQEILDQLNRGAMPPKEQPRPDAKEAARAVDVLTARLKAAYAARRSTGARTVIRRLNRFELRNTVRDLLYINDPELRIGNTSGLVDNNGNGRVENTSSDPFRDFPADEQIDGFDNIGDRLVMSGFFLKLMLAAAEDSLALATETAPRPKLTTRRLAGHIQKQGSGDLERYAREIHPDFDALYRSGALKADALGRGVGTSARYRITVEVSGHNQKHPWGELIKTKQDEPFLLDLRLHKTRTRYTQIPLVQWQLPGDGKTRTFSVETWIDKSWSPQLSWGNGPSDRVARRDLLIKQFLPDVFKQAPDRKKVPKEDFKKLHDAWSGASTTALLNDYRGPSVRVHSLTLTPLIDRWPPKSHTALYGTGPADKADIEALLLAFATRAFRRPVTPADVAPYVTLVRRMTAAPKAASGGVIQDLTYKSYKGSWSKLPKFSTLTPIGKGVLADGLLDIRAAQMDEHFGIVFEGKLTAPQAGDYEFQISSDDGSRLIVDGKKIVEHDGLHGASTKKGSVKLAAGQHTVRVEYFAFGKPNSLRASWSGPGFAAAPLSVGKTAPRQLTADNAQAARSIKALQAGYAAMLCSPRFLYIEEHGRRLDQYEIASRLSYFLWSSMPDEKLLALAKAGKLTDAAVLRQQVDRMLGDRRAGAFTRHFTERWLRLDKLSDSPPERSGPFRVYWDRQLETQIVAQTDAYFADLVKTNGPVRHLIDSDYTFLNESIATVFYRRDDVKGEFLRKVPTNDPRRGGIFTQPSVMTATANGVDTSPVVRGVWVLQNVLGTPPSPPPPDVEPLSPDLRNAKSIREQILLHRKQAACNSCHREIDPMGFAFENFDPIGRWRDRYPRAKGNIDASATTATGQKIAGIVEFKKMLLTRERDVTRCLTEKLLAYGSGRVLEPIDRGEVDLIVSKMADPNSGLRDLIKLIVESEVFLNK